MKKLFLLFILLCATSFIGWGQVVNADKIGTRPVTSGVNALEGNVSGVWFNSNNARSLSSINIRGIGSINASNDALIVLDGMPYSGDLDMINPSDIESIRVLKDPVDISIYGMRGANGVIEIKTKKGKLTKSTTPQK